MSIDLKQKDQAVSFYNLRYGKGYMDDWSKQKKERVSSLIKELNLPAQGRALEFGCGNGVFSWLLKETLPGWNVTGCDISDEGIKLARQRYPEIKFGLCDDLEIKAIKYDLVFTHHTLEHVQDIEAACQEMNGFLGEKAFMLHILPCGNEDSFEYKFCQLVKNGINANQEGRFFFEDPGHLRRLTSGRLSGILAKHNFSLSKEYYANQFMGAINWMSKASPVFILKNILSAKAVNLGSAGKLFLYKIFILFLAVLRQPAVLLERFYSNYKFIPINIIFLFLYPISKPVDLLLKWLATEEWNKKRMDKNGSEMYLFFSR